MAAAHEQLTLTVGEMTVETHIYHKYTCIHRYTHPFTLDFKDYNDVKIYSLNNP